jgi:hypothetical protein
MATTPAIEAIPFPTLREALPGWIDRQERAGEVRGGTPSSYRSRLTTRVYPQGYRRAGSSGMCP